MYSVRIDSQNSLESSTVMVENYKHNLSFSIETYNSVRLSQGRGAIAAKV